MDEKAAFKGGIYRLTGRYSTMSEGMKGSTKSEDDLYAILDRLHVAYLSKEPVRPSKDVALLPDCVIVDKRYYPGVIEVNGAIHKTHGSRKWDAKKEEYYGAMHLWCEFVENRDVKRENIEAILARHAHKVEEFP
jgi:hypothetical protein